MRLLMITQDFPPGVGGIQTYAHELARRFAGRCSRLEVIAPAAEGSAEVDAELPFLVHRLPVGPDQMVVAAPAAAPLVVRGEFDAVFHGHWYTAAAGLWLRRLGRARRVFVAAHGRELLLNEVSGLPALGVAYERVRRAVARRVDAFFAVSAYTAGLLRGLGVSDARVHVVGNGADPERLRAVDASAWRRAHGLEDAPTLVTLGRLVPRKGIDTVLASLPAIAAEVPTVRYVVAGTGPDRARLEELARSLGVASRVAFVGQVADHVRAQVLSAADVFVMPARSEPPDVEGFGLVYLEAGACERPVVGARAGGVPDAIVHGETGYLVEPDDPAAVARTCIELLRDPARAAALGRRGRQRVVDTATWDHAADRIFDAMQACS